jgi:hypothetical protein
VTVLPVQRATNVTQGLVWGAAAPGGSIITSGVVADLYVPWDFAISEWVVQARPAGTISFDLWAALGETPGLAQSILGPLASHPGLADAAYAESDDLTGWDTHHPAGSTLTLVIEGGVIAIAQFTFTAVVRRV